MKGKVVVITGATSGIGRAAAIALANMGAQIVILARDEVKGTEMVGEIGRRSINADAQLIRCDLADMGTVRKAASEVLARNERVDVLVLNAGVIMGRRTLTEDGFEYTFGISHLAHFVLANLLLERLRESAPSRIVVTSSYSHMRGHMDFDDLMGEKAYRPFRAYGQAKLANVLLTFELARRLKRTGVTANCYHPGPTRTNIGKGFGSLGAMVYPLAGPFMLPAEKGADTLVYLASSPDVEGVTGRYFFERKVIESSAESKDPEEARRLWEISERLTAEWLSPIE
jgi:NAD(P)-dependent dehydrogenase (short-subunit alcohol dehydrogenase family)